MRSSSAILAPAGLLLRPVLEVKTAPGSRRRVKMVLTMKLKPMKPGGQLQRTSLDSLARQPSGDKGLDGGAVGEAEGVL